VPPALTWSSGTVLAAVLANREEVQKGLGFLLRRINNAETQAKSHGVSNAGGLARNQRGSCQEPEDGDSPWGMHFQDGSGITCIPLSGNKPGSWTLEAGQVFIPSPVCGGDSCGQENWGWYCGICLTQLLLEIVSSSSSLPCSSRTCSWHCCFLPQPHARKSSAGCSEHPAPAGPFLLRYGCWQPIYLNRCFLSRLDAKLRMVLLTCKKKYWHFLECKWNTFCFKKIPQLY